MQLFKKNKQTQPMGNSKAKSDLPKDSSPRKFSNSRVAGMVSVLVTICLLFAGGAFVMSVSRRAADDASKKNDSQDHTSSEEGLSGWLGLAPITRILSPASEDTAVYTFSDGSPLKTEPESGVESANDASVSTASSNTASGGSSKSAPAKSASSETAPAGSIADQSKIADTSTEDSAKKETSKEDSSVDQTSKAKASAKKKDSGKETDSAGKNDSEKKKASDSKSDNSKSDKDEKSKKSDDKKSNSDSLTKTQKKYVANWEANHFRTFPLNTGLHDYNWKYLKYDDNGVLQYKGDDDYTVRHGIDVSEFQGQIDWEKVKKAGYDFVFVRAGHRTFHTGSLERDTRALKNLTRAKKAGFDVGVYVFSQAVSIDEAIEEAELCLDVIEESGVKITLPVVFDPEIQLEYDARINYISNDQFTDNAVAFCETIKEAGYTPAIYANCSTETDILNMSRLENAEIWYADYGSVPESPYRFTFWQYTSMGWVDGIPETETDLNLWFIKKD